MLNEWNIYEKWLNIVVPPLLKRNVQQTLLASGIENYVKVPDLEKVIRQEYATNRVLTKKIGGLQVFDYQKYHPLNEIYDWIYAIAKQYSDIVDVFNVTTSFEGRPLTTLKISVPNSSGKRKPAIWFDGGIHSREWISPATVIYMTYRVIIKL